MKKKMLIPICIAGGCLAGAIFTGIKTNGAGVVSASVVDAFNLGEENETAANQQVIDVTSAASVSSILAGVQEEEAVDEQDAEAEEDTEAAEEAEEAEADYDSDIVEAEAVAPVFEEVSPVWNETEPVVATAQPKETAVAPVAVKKAEVKKTEVKENNKSEVKENIKASNEEAEAPKTEVKEETAKPVDEIIDDKEEDYYLVGDIVFVYVFEKGEVRFLNVTKENIFNPEKTIEEYYINDDKVSAEEYEERRANIMEDTSLGELVDAYALGGSYSAPSVEEYIYDEDQEDLEALKAEVEVEEETEADVEVETDWVTETSTSQYYYFENEEVSFSIHSITYEINTDLNVEKYYINDDEVSADEYEKELAGILDDESRGELLDMKAVSGCNTAPVE